jgi:hypothetical protein
MDERPEIAGKRPDPLRAKAEQYRQTTNPSRIRKRARRSSWRRPASTRRTAITLRQDPYFDYAEALFQIAIVLVWRKMKYGACPSGGGEFVEPPGRSAWSSP